MSDNESDSSIDGEQSNIDDVFDEQNSKQASACGQLVLYQENPIQDIAILNKNFDLTTIPSNYMRKRSKVEEIIYRAVYSQNSHKSPFSSFKTAKMCISDLDKVDIVTGISNLKSVVRSVYDKGEQISIMVHKVGPMWLMDEFDINDVILRNHYFTNWEWLREFIKQQNFQLVKPQSSRSSLESRDLYAKFLYHSVSQLNPELPKALTNVVRQDETPMLVSTYLQPTIESHSTKSSNLFYKEDFLNLLDWKLEDLSFVVGSDLSIFGTKKHPCISLRLNPSQQPISVLTGIDIWLENLLNEVPEVAMCYHSEGIVMREYEILQTDEMPNLVGFDQSEVKSIAKNLGHFLMSNATKEGHTYWLFKESDSTTVKLYDLTTIWENDKQQTAANEKIYSNDMNPFILPVAILCYRVAEKRINQWFKARKRCGKTKLTSTMFNKKLLDSNLADNQYYFSEIFRLLKNCINLLLKIDRHDDLKKRAMMLMCRLYMEVDETTLDSLSTHRETINPMEMVGVNLNELKCSELSVSNCPGSNDEQILINNYSQLEGSKLFDFCKKHSTEDIMNQALLLMEEHNDGSNAEEEQKQKESFSSIIPKNEVEFKNAMLYEDNCNKNNRLVKEGDYKVFDLSYESLLDGVSQYYVKQCCTVADIKECKDLEVIRDVLKSGFMLAVLDDQLWSTDWSIVRDIQCYDSLIKAFMMWQVDLVDDCSRIDGGEQLEKSSSSILKETDRRILKLYYKDDQKKLIDTVLLLRAIFVVEKQRKQLPVNDAVHRGWYYAVVFLTNLAYRLYHLKITKPMKRVIRRSMPVLLNFFVDAIVSMYQQNMLRLHNLKITETEVATEMADWCRSTVLPCMSRIDEWVALAAASSHGNSSNSEPKLQVLAWSNKARLCRLAYSLLNSDISYLYESLESYRQALAVCSGHSATVTSSSSNSLAVNIRGDRLDVCMTLLELTYAQSASETEESLKEMKKTVDLCEKILHGESVKNSLDWLNLKVTGVRLRLSFVKYYLSLKTNKPLNYDQVLSNLKSGFQFMINNDSLDSWKDVLLILFYYTKIQADKSDILSISSLRKFVIDDADMIMKAFVTFQEAVSLNNEEAEKMLLKIYNNFLITIGLFIVKCQNEANRKKKSLFDQSKIEQLNDLITNKLETMDISTQEKLKLISDVAKCV